MPVTYSLIGSATVGSGGASSITFSNIPAVYTDLVVKVSARNSDAVNQLGLYIWLNNDRSNIYTYRTLQGSGSAVGSGSYTNTAVDIGQLPGANATANTFNNAEFYIPNYTSSNNKSISMDTVQENNTTTAYADLHAGLWPSSAVVNRIDISALTAGNFVQYTTAYLYGIKKS